VPKFLSNTKMKTRKITSQLPEVLNLKTPLEGTVRIDDVLRYTSTANQDTASNWTDATSEFAFELATSESVNPSRVMPLFICGCK
jgi:hypothetical protein